MTAYAFTDREVPEKVIANMHAINNVASGVRAYRDAGDMADDHPEIAGMAKTYADAGRTHVLRFEGASPVGIGKEAGTVLNQGYMLEGCPPDYSAAIVAEEGGKLAVQEAFEW